MPSSNNIFSQLLSRAQYFIEYMKEFHRYQYILEGEVHNKNESKTTLLYRVRGKRDIFEIQAQQICNNPAMITKFHPLDIRIISYIAGIEQILDVLPEQRLERFSFIKKKIFNKS